MSLEANGGRRARLWEIFWVVLSSAIGSAALVAATIPVTLARFEERITTQKASIEKNTRDIAGLQSHDSTQSAQQAAADAHYQDILRRLDSIDRKLER